MVDYIIYKEVEGNGIEHIDELLPIYNEKVKDSDKKARFKALCDRYFKTQPGQPSPAFAFEDVDGNVVKLSDLAGKYVYIDCWATWCGPCQREQPYLAKLEKEYSNSVYFVSISCDRDRSVWEKEVREKKLGGIQLHEGNDQSFSIAYTITTIPRFILLDKEGKIVNANMTRPSDPKTKEVLDSLVRR